MNRIAIAIAVTFCACKQQETPHAEAITQNNPIAPDNVASPTTSATPVASASASAYAPWGREDPLSARGNMWGDSDADAFGVGGLGLTGVGEGGGRGEGIGLGNIGTLGNDGGFGNGHGRLGSSHDGKVPRIRQGAMSVNGRLPPEVIQRIVRQNFGRFRLCYEAGLQRNAQLAGTVSTKFVIDRQGSVINQGREASTTLADAAVITCVVNSFSSLSFPQPEGGIVVVIYPLIFEAPDTAP